MKSKGPTHIHGAQNEDDVLNVCVCGLDNASAIKYTERVGVRFKSLPSLFVYFVVFLSNSKEIPDSTSKTP
jgi:hypothetical protein